MRLEDRFDKEMDDAKGQINQLTKTMDDDARGAIVAMKRDMNQMNKDLQLLLRQSTFDDKRPAASTTSNGQSIASGDDETVFSFLLRHSTYFGCCQL